MRTSQCIRDFVTWLFNCSSIRLFGFAFDHDIQQLLALLDIPSASGALSVTGMDFQDGTLDLLGWSQSILGPRAKGHERPIWAQQLFNMKSSLMYTYNI